VFAVASLVFLTSTAAKGTIDVSVSVVLSDDLVLSRRGRGSCLWLDLDDPSGARRTSDVGAEIYARVDGNIATTNPIESLLASVGLVVSLFFNNAHRWW
jgi:hypothetical protein